MQRGSAESASSGREVRSDADSELGLLARWRAGDAIAANCLFRRYSRALRAFFARRGAGNPDDLAQETLLAVFEGAARLKRAEAFRAYVFGTARLQLLVHLRRTSRERARLQASGDESLGRLVAETEAEERQDGLERLMGAIEVLDLPFREVVRLAYFEGQSAPQMAKLLGLPLGTVYSRLQRAKLRLLESTQHATASAERA